MSSASTGRVGARYWLVLSAMLAGFGLLAVRAFYLQVVQASYLQNQADATHLRIIEDDSHRGMILDRNGEPLAISTPVDSVWAVPGELAQARNMWPALTRMLGIPEVELAQAVRLNAGRQFMYIDREIAPQTARRVMALHIPGIALQREYRRYYPAGPVTGQLIGFTNVDDVGQEGVELEYNNWLRAIPGKERVLQDRYGNIVQPVESISLPVPGRNLILSIDRRIQFLTYRALMATIRKYHARAASAVVVNVRTGEVLAVVNVPSFNPNNRSGIVSSLVRDRAVTDEYEPGSVLKPFTIGAAMDAGKIQPTTLIDTSPGSIQVGGYTIRDDEDSGTISVAQVIERSSNVGATKIALSLKPRTMWNMFRLAGFGEPTGVGLPGEAPGFVRPYQQWVPSEQATMSFGYGISVTVMQLAQAFAGIANDGMMMPVTILRRDQPVVGRRIMSETTAREMRAMLELVVSNGGTAPGAAVANYLVAGKTGTAHKLGRDGYRPDSYYASFAGFVPASDPRLAMVIMVNNPRSSEYYGGEVAAPVFSRVMTGALRLLNIPPDNLPHPQRWVAQAPAAGTGGGFVRIVAQGAEIPAEGRP